MKKCIALFLFCCMMLTGCTNPIQLNERAIVQAIGIDYADDQYLLTLLCYSPVGTTGEEAAQTTQTNAKRITARGESLADAFEKIELKNGKRNFYGHNDLVILGKDAAQQKLGNVLSHMSGDLNLRANVEFLVAENTADEILSAKPDENMLPTTALYNTIQNAKQEGMVPCVRFLDIANAYLGEKRDIWIPLVGVEPVGKDRHTYVLSGAAIYKQDQFVGTLDEEEVLGLNLCLEKLRNKVISIPQADGLAVNLTNVKPTLHTANGRLSVNITCDAIVLDTDLDLYARTQASIAQEVESYLQNLVQKSVSKVMNDYGANLFSQDTLKQADVQVMVRIEKNGNIAIPS